jgi:hypothetical protein
MAQKKKSGSFYCIVDYHVTGLKVVRMTYMTVLYYSLCSNIIQTRLYEPLKVESRHLTGVFRRNDYE